MALIGTRTEEWTPHDSNEIAPRITGFIPDADGSFEGRAYGDTVDRTFNVLGGVFYPIDLLLAKNTGKVGVAELLLVRAEVRGG